MKLSEIRKRNRLPKGLMMTHTELVRRAESWLRCSARIPGYPGIREDATRRVQCGVVLTEYTSGCTESPDAIGWFFCGKHSILVECKASRSDFLADRNKHFRGEFGTKFGLGMFRYYLTNTGIAKPDEIPENWGLLEAIGRRVKLIVVAKSQEYSQANELSLLWSECRKIQIVERGGKLIGTRAGVRITELVKRGIAEKIAN